MKKVFSSLSVYSIENFHVLSNENKVKYMNIALDNRKKSPLPPNTYNYKIVEDPTSFYFLLYYKFFSFCKNCFYFTESSQNNNSSWVYLSNNRDYASVFHHHKETCTINSVYYLNVPDKNSGEIEFFGPNDEIFKYYPSTFELIIFPNHLVHKPNFSNSKEWRVAINMEIKTEESSLELFSRLEKKHD